MNYDWNFKFLWEFRSAFWNGLLTTLELSVLSAAIGTAVGIGLGVLYRILPFRRSFLLLNDVLRALPLLVLLLFIYYFPYNQIFGIRPPSPFACAVSALAVSQAAFTADLVVAAIGNVPSRSIQSARALGMREATILRYIILPDILRQMLPSLLAFYVGIVKLSSLASIIGCEDVVFVARVVTAKTFRSLEAWVIVACVYVVLIVPLTAAVRHFETSQWLKRRA